ncbi:hypothetical protein GGI05_004950 [Coemansia sp. RSA 2603]|nr:hypothetical protein GGI05_004950 [Coemansia sp. RSA 2603]
MDEILKVKNGFGADDDVSIHSSDMTTGTLTLHLTVCSHHLTAAGTLDEGMVATLADNYTTYLLIAHSLALDPAKMPISVSVSLTVQALAPVSPGTVLQIVCRAGNAELQKPFAEAVFADCSDPSVVYARASHTKHLKDVMGFEGSRSGRTAAATVASKL